MANIGQDPPWPILAMEDVHKHIPRGICAPVANFTWDMPRASSTGGLWCQPQQLAPCIRVADNLHPTPCLILHCRGLTAQQAEYMRSQGVAATALHGGMPAWRRASWRAAVACDGGDDCVVATPDVLLHAMGQGHLTVCGLPYA